MNFNNNDGPDVKGLLLAIFLSVVAVLVFDRFLPKQTDSTEIHASAVQNTEKSIDKLNQEDINDSLISEEEALSSANRIPIKNGKLIGSIDLDGGIIDYVSLKEFKETTDDSSKNVEILKPKNTKEEYYISILYSDKTNDNVIGEKIVWINDDSDVENAVFLRAKTKDGLIIDRTITLDDKYLIKIIDKILNTSDKDIKISNRVNMLRRSPTRNNYAVVHEGLVFLNDGKVKDVKYEDISKKNILKKCSWIGFTDHYWLCSMLNEENTIVEYRNVKDDLFSVSSFGQPVVLKKNSEMERNYAFFLGPKDAQLLKSYQEEFDIDKFEMNIDFGWFFFLTKPLLCFLDILQSLFSNMGIVVLVLTILFKILTHPLTRRAYVSAAKMKEVQPKIVSLQTMYANDKMKLNQEILSLYKKEKISPLSGCLPMLLQAPVFFCLYKVFFISIKMRHAPLFLWINDLSAPDPYYIFNLFGLIDWSPPAFLKIGTWPLIMGITMFIQQRMTSSKSNNVPQTQEAKIQKNMFLFLPLVFTFVCASFPVGVVVYWTVSSVFGLLQQCYVNHSLKKSEKLPCQ